MAAAQNPIDWEALETAVERNSPDAESFLETTSGQVITIVRGDPEAAQLKAKVAANIDNYIRVEPASSREQYRWMERFVASVSDEPLQRRLVISIDGKGAFRRFKDVLLAYPAERERWFSYRSNLLHWHIQNWLANHGMEGMAPWGEIEAPTELEPASSKPPVPVTSAPGESLRRQARELIDGIEPLDLPSAIAFLQFLEERGSAALEQDQENAEVPPRPKIVK
jgi:hypothetical protein